MPTKQHQDRIYLDKLLRYCLHRWQLAERRSHGAGALKYATRANHYFAACDRVARLSRMAG